MKLDLVIRYMGIIVLKKQLEPGEYTVGRSKDSDILLTQSFISRKHGKVFFKEGKWFYQSLKAGLSKIKVEPAVIEEKSIIEIADNMELLRETFLYDADTKIFKIKMPRAFHLRMRAMQTRSTIITVAIMLAVLAGAMAYFLIGHQKPGDINSLFNLIRPKVVELEFVRNVKLIEDVKKYSELKDKDFKENAGFCTGFIIAPNVVLTASHCLRLRSLAETNEVFQVKAHDGSLYKASRVLGFNPERDYLFIEVPNLEKYGYLKLNPAYEIGQKVYTVGNVHGEGIAIREGIMASTTQDRNNPDIEYLRYSAAASPGNSGGPLVNDKGECMGIVFASTWTENYNLATSAEYLIEGKNKYVEDLSKKQIEIDTSRIFGYWYTALLYSFAFPVPSIWRERPEYPRPLEKLKVSVTVPREIEPFSNELTNNFHEMLSSAYVSVMDVMKKNDEHEGRWRDFPTKKMPMIVTSQIASKTQKYHVYNDIPYPVSTSISFPITRYSYEQKAKLLDSEGFTTFEGQMVSAEILLPKEEERKENETISYRTSTDEVVYFPTSYRPDLQVKLDYSGESYRFSEENEIEDSIILSDFLGKEGRLLNTYHIPFIRPKSHRNFRLREFENKPVRSVRKDQLERKWEITNWDILDSRLDLYCLKMPQGYLCLSSFFEFPQSQSMTKIQIDNFLKYSLAELIIEPIFWRLDPLIEYLDNQKPYYDPILSDVEIKKEDLGTLSINLKTMGVKYNLSKKEIPLMISIYGGIYGENPKETKWVATGFEAYYQKPEKRICGSGVDFKNKSFTYILKEYRDFKENTKKKKELEKKGINIKEGPKIRITEAKLGAEKRPSQIYSFCGKLDKRSGRKTYDLDFYKLKPFDVKYSIR